MIDTVNSGSAEYQNLIAQSLDALGIKTAAHDRMWNLEQADWSIDQDRGVVEFLSADETTAVCPVQIIGTYNQNESTWLWGWEHPSVDAKLTQHAEFLRKFGEANSIEELTTRQLCISEEKCWEFAALACNLNEAQGAYRGPAGSTLIFMTFGEPTLSSGAAPVIAVEQSVNGDVSLPGEVREVVDGFINALYEWEVTSNAESEAADGDEEKDEEAWQNAQRSYVSLVQTWCSSQVTAQGISFGSNPSHGPAEQFLSASKNGDQWHVRTQHVGAFNKVSDYEYRVGLEGDQWRILNLFWVDGAELHEML